MRRRGFVLFAMAPLLRADDRTDALDALASLAAALADGDTGLALSVLPRNDPNYMELRANITALIAQSGVTSSVEVISAEKGSAELDWYMEIRSRETQMIVERRRGAVKIRHRRKRLEALSPASFFAPPN